MYFSTRSQDDNYLIKEKEKTNPKKKIFIIGFKLHQALVLFARKPERSTYTIYVKNNEINLIAFFTANLNERGQKLLHRNYRAYHALV